MKHLKHITRTLIMLIAISATAQQGINYKALVKDSGGNVIANQNVDIQFIIYEGPGETTNVYQETHSLVLTDANGIIIINIGEGAVDSGIYDDLDWGADDHYLNVQIDTGSGLTDMGTTEFMTVPYALHSSNVDGAAFKSSSGLTGNINLFDNYVFGSTQLDDTGDLNDDARFFFNKSKSAFRAGTSEDNQWDNANLGTWSFAAGVNTTASGAASFAIGSNTTASGLYALASGHLSTASGNWTTVLGNSLTASSDYAIAMGRGSEASGENSTAMGNNTMASGNVSTVMGIDNVASGEGSTSTGLATVASGNYSFSAGFETDAESYGSFSIGRYNPGGGSADAWIETDPLFEIGIGTSNANRARALTVLKNGNVGIGSLLPIYTLDISSTTGIGSRVNMIGAATGTKYGSYIQVLTTGDFQQFGTYNNVQGSGNANHHGIFNNMGGDGGGTKYGSYNSLNGNGDGNHYGFYSTVIGSGSGAHIGFNSDMIANGSGNNFGNRNVLSGTGTGNKYGTYNYINQTAEGSHFGVYSEALKSGSFAGYFLGTVAIGTEFTNLYKLPASRGSNGDIMQTDGSGNVSWTSVVTSTGLEALSEGNGIGWRLIGQDPANYGNIGIDAVDLSKSIVASEIYGATGSNSLSLGQSTTASGTSSTAMGFYSTASGVFSTAMSNQTTSSGDYSTAMGTFSTASGTSSTAMGHSTTASGLTSVAMGLATKAESSFSTAIGRFNIGGGDPTNWIGTNPLFEIGNGADTNNRANAMTVLKNGDVGIGTPTPTERLEVISTAESGKAIFSQGTGIYGKGIHAKVTSTHSSANAILAESGGGSSYAGYFVGNVHVAGVLSKSSGSFKIDHPLYPENKYLSHSFVESPDMMNIYNGNVTTDKNGNAIVELPDYFEALNMDFRYQLTVIGQFAQAIVNKKIEGNCFEIKTDKPNVEVSWQVTGVRNDAFARKNRIKVEEEKKLENIGTYLNPEAFKKNAAIRKYK